MTARDLPGCSVVRRERGGSRLQPPGTTPSTRPTPTAVRGHAARASARRRRWHARPHGPVMSWSPRSEVRGQQSVAVVGGTDRVGRGPGSDVGWRVCRSCGPSAGSVMPAPTSLRVKRDGGVSHTSDSSSRGHVPGVCISAPASTWFDARAWMSPRDAPSRRRGASRLRLGAGFGNQSGDRVLIRYDLSSRPRYGADLRRRLHRAGRHLRQRCARVRSSGLWRARSAARLQLSITRPQRAAWAWLGSAWSRRVVCDRPEARPL